MPGVGFVARAPGGIPVKSARPIFNVKLLLGVYAPPGDGAAAAELRRIFKVGF